MSKKYMIINFIILVVFLAIIDILLVLYYVPTKALNAANGYHDALGTDALLVKFGTDDTFIDTLDQINKNIDSEKKSLEKYKDNEVMKEQIEAHIENTENTKYYYSLFEMFYSSYKKSTYKAILVINPIVILAYAAIYIGNKKRRR